MSTWMQAVFAFLFLGAASPQAPPAANPPAAAIAPVKSTPVQTTAPTPPAAANSPTVGNPTDPALLAVRAEIERILKSTEQAEAAAPDEASRARIRMEKLTQLTLLLLRQQEQLYQQNQALLAALTATRPVTRTATAGKNGVVSSPQANLPAGPLFAKRGGGGKVHRPGCRFGERIAPGTRITFPAVAQASAAGYQPCKICRPDR